MGRDNTKQGDSAATRKKVTKPIKQSTKTCKQCKNDFKGHGASLFCSDLCMFMTNAAPTSHTECWRWRGKTGKYPKVARLKGDWRMVHRFTYELFWRPIPKGLIVRHLCNERSCVNPFHLVTGTHKDNSQDMTKAYRQCHGPRHGAAKLTEKDISAIRADTESTHTELAKRYGVSYVSIRNVREGKTWKFVASDMQTAYRSALKEHTASSRIAKGVDPLLDAYIEALNLAMALRAKIENRSVELTQT